MHPFLKSPIHFAVTVLLWLPVMAGFITLQQLITNEDWIELAYLMAPPLFILLFLLLSTWYLCKSVELKNKNILEFIGRHLLSAAISLIVWLFAAMLYSEILVLVTENDSFRQMFSSTTPLFIIICLLLYFLSTSVNYLVLAIEQVKEAETQALENNLAAAKSELRALQATIHPHFLFNSLTAMTSLIRISPEKAESSCEQLSNFLRYSLKLGQSDFVTLQEELNGIEDYLSIEQIRLGERLKTNIKADEKLLEVLLPPFTLLPLVENSIKHGISRLVLGGEVVLNISVENNFLLFSIKNPFDESEKADYGEGMGLRTLRKKLESVYGFNFSLDAAPLNETFHVDLKIPLVKDKEQARQEQTED